MEFLIFLKILFDTLWEYKIFNIVYIFLICTLALILFFSQKINKFIILKSEFFLLLFLTSIIFSYLQARNFELATIDFVKLLPLGACYIVGRLWPRGVKVDFLSVFSVISIFLFFIASLLGVGYEYWGNVKTFIALYYFKTDLAIAVLVFLVFIFASNLKLYIKTIAFLLGAYLVFEANSRIAIPIMMLQIILYWLGTKRFLLNLGRSLILLFIFSFISIGIFSLINFSSLGMVGFDITSPFSDSSTQGRNHIWAALIDFYNNLDIFHKIFGSGLAADIEAAQQFSDPGLFEESRAHNSYLWMLVCVGWLGIVFFFMFITYLIKLMKSKVKVGKYNETNYYIFISLLMIFLIMSMSVEVIVRTQLTFLLFLYAGLCSNPRFNNS